MILKIKNGALYNTPAINAYSYHQNQTPNTFKTPCNYTKKEITEVVKTNKNQENINVTIVIVLLQLCILSLGMKGHCTLNNSNTNNLKTFLN